MKWTLIAGVAALTLSGILVASNAQSRNSGDQKVTLRLQNASVSELGKWLADKGINFVIDQRSAEKDLKLNINLRSVPLKDALDAISDALGGSWSKRGSVYVFKQGQVYEWPTADGFSFATPKVPSVPGVPAPPNFQPARKPDGKTKVYQYTIPPIPSQDLEKSIHEFVKKIQSMAQGSAQKGVDEKAIQKEVDEFVKKVNSQSGTWAVPPMPPLDELKELQNLKVEIPKMDLKELKELQNLKVAIPKLDQKELEHLKIIIPRMDLDELKDLKNLKFKGLEDLRTDMPKIAVVPSIDSKSLLDSLTAEQKEKQSKQGYLTPDDLTGKQKALLGLSKMKGDWTISISQDGQTVTIKSK